MQSKFVLIKEINWQVYLHFSVNTHCHADHITGTGILKSLVSCKSMISEAAGAKADVFLHDGDMIKFGEHVSSLCIVDLTFLQRFRS